jgi:hypothetical protein
MIADGIASNSMPVKVLLFPSLDTSGTNTENNIHGASAEIIFSKPASRLNGVELPFVKASRSFESPLVAPNISSFACRKNSGGRALNLMIKSNVFSIQVSRK